MSDETSADESERNASVIVIGGGPAGLSAALFTAKNGLETTVFDADETWMHKAHLFNYLGIGSVGGSEFMATARQQVDDFGADRRQGEEVTAVGDSGEGFVVETSVASETQRADGDSAEQSRGKSESSRPSGDDVSRDSADRSSGRRSREEAADDDGEYEADYVVLATGANRDLAEELGVDFAENGTVDVGVEMETSVEGAYATGAMVRPEEWQAAIAVGDGAAAALNILSSERGEHYHDFDVPADAERVFGELVAE
ncbi:FAD-dependent pyridine nucleotide-disulphide oxidoreductase [Haloterrigena turkmenica DSM 5511]|uniref:FAD-dependent pyridine nucleotide-disulphide oxidoreductase n=1 Tax=Haloterrigena turkmenica (strain ATCC 51198 / DSM 5511 / JCM 9101 / NCIMB 13204 / VKM B-1734 / 4k) TaxID=543526 RepID=D2RUA4_HALTV|nr:FAD-dependent oxidoreductase [Haloterrigena turkmenica]ADB59173.1 FAD-dependent pyridine nucleotide-disulphide oxidoreductase [Haloterrigena turkmenica DSM 5511]